MKMRTRALALVLALLTMLGTPVSAWATTVDASTYAQWLQDAQTVSQRQLQTTVQETPVSSTTEITLSGSTVDRTGAALALSGAALPGESLPEESLTLPIAGSAQLHATGGASAYQWQVYAGGVWANILGDTSATLALTYPMLSNALDGDSAMVRCRMEANGETHYSPVTRVTVDRTVTTTPVSTKQSVAVASTEYTTTRQSNANSGIMLLSTTYETYLITIQNLFEDDTPAANPIIIQTGSSSGTSEYTGTVALPRVTGFQVQAPTGLPTGVTYDANNQSLIFNDFSVSQDISITITYIPALVSFTVIYHQQHVNDDKYDQVRTQAFTGYTNAPVSKGNDLAPETKYAGFKPLIYDEGTPIAADGSTIVNIYYDRQYYLMTFDLAGGIGVDPIYARYGAAVSIPDPTRSGYSFKGWDNSLPATIPAYDTKFTAQWTAGTTSFTVVYWLDDPNDTTKDKAARKYNYWGSVVVNNIESGVKIDGEDYKEYGKYSDLNNSLDAYEKKYSTFSHADEDVVIKGDGSSVVNVYYVRNEYTLRFYYAFSTGAEDNKSYYVIGGSTHYFGSAANTSDNSNSTTFLDTYMNKYSGHRGEVKNLPTLNAKGASRPYTQGEVSSTVNGTAYKYHYLELTAKYGADLTNLWPCDIFDSVDIAFNRTDWSGTKAYFSAWNGEYYVYYTQKFQSTNQTIKGNYTMLDYQLLWDPAKVNDDSKTVDYLCFWENGANIDWSKPELYVYNIYYEMLPGQNADADKIKSYKNKNYVLADSYSVVDDSNVEQQTTVAIAGMTNVGREATGNIKDSSNPEHANYVEVYELYYYYDRTRYTLELNNAGTIEPINGIAFGQDISQYGSADREPTPPKDMVGTHEFAGWYLDPDCVDGTEYTFTGDQATMPDHNLMLYAKWKPVSHYVDVYLTKAMMEAGSTTPGERLYTGTILHGEYIPALDDPTNEPYVFVHWFYESTDENGNTVERAFDFNSIPVTHDLKIYAKWSTNTVMTYKIYYVKQGSNDSIGDPTVWVADLSDGSALAGTTKTFMAKGVDELFPEYQTNWFPLVQSHSFEIAIDGENTYTFEYVRADSVPYKVRHVIIDDGKETLYTEQTISDNNKAVATETFELIPGYVPDALQKTLVITYSNKTDVIPENVITFYYTKDESSASYIINHHLIDAKGNTTLRESETSTATMSGSAPTTITAEKLTLDGYIFDHADCQLADSDNNTSYDKATHTVTLKKGSAGFVMDLYYRENTADIQYKVASGSTGLGTVSTTQETMGVITGVPQGSTPTASTNYKFVGWYADDACTQPIALGVSADGTLMPTRTGSQWQNATYYAKFVLNVADLTITKQVVDVNTGDNHAPNPNDEFSFRVEISGAPYAGTYTVGGTPHATRDGVITLKAGEAASISDVTIGESYSVTELDLPAGYVCAAPAYSGTINANSNAVTITNTYSVYSLTITKKVVGADAPANTVFTFTLSLPDGNYTAVTNGNTTTTLTAINGKASVSLADGNTVVISGIPCNAAYAVDEVNHPDYTVTAADYTSGTLNTDANITFTNTYRYSHLTVTKQGMNQGSALVYITVDGVTYAVVLNADNGWSQTISRLPIGESISVEEATDWSWRYGGALTIEQDAQVNEGGSAVTITNAQSTTQWLSDESYVTNIFTGQSNQ